MAAATAALTGLLSSHAMALSLGRILVQSALGEPLRAEVEILDINAEEAASLKTAIAGPDAFRAAGLDYHPALTGVKMSLERRANGQAYLRLSSDRAINDPFVDMILEASWSSGRIVRDYTMLFDPPNLRPSAQVAGSAPAQVTAPQISTAQPSAPGAAGGRASTARPPVAVAAKPGPAAAPAPAAARKPADGAQQVTVKTGDTASKIAASIKPANVSLDQMLVAMLRGNPEAFLGGNINRIKAGAVLNVPTEQQAQASSVAEASQTIVAQSKDFNDYRRKLAGTAPVAQVAPADRKASGSVQAKVEEKKPSAAAPDKLTLSKGAIQAKAAEDNLAKERAAKDAAARNAELSKNLADLNKVASAAGAPPPAAKASADKPASPAVAVPTAPPPTATTPAPVAAASAPVSAAAPVAAATKPPVKKPVVTAPPPPEPSMLDEVLENPLLPAGGGLLVALLGGFAFYRMRQAKKTAPVDSAYLESRLQPDSFFGASGGQQIDTNDGAATGSSMVYSPSQLDAADDVDPVAEADVYLAYGRDMQAEEILKEALRTNPQRLAIHQKLLDIYAKRRDGKAFENIANQAYKLTDGEGPDWQRICELGLTFDPSNPLYQPGGAPFGGSESKLAALDVSAVLDQPAPPNPAEGATPVDLDLDLDFSLDDDATHVGGATQATATPLSATPATEQTVRMQAVDQTVRMHAEPEESPMPTLDLEFGDSVPGAMAPAPAATPAPAASADNALEFDLPELPQAAQASAADSSLGTEDFEQQAAVSFGSTAPAPLAGDSAKAAAPREPDTGMLEFDLGSLSLDLGDSTEGTSLATPPAPEDPLATKLALAEEFNAIGDADGARALIEEVVAEASGDMKAKAQRALAAL